MHPASLVVSSGGGLWDLLTTCTDRRLKLYMLKPTLIQRKPESEYIQRTQFVWHWKRRVMMDLGVRLGPAYCKSFP